MGQADERYQDASPFFSINNLYECVVKCERHLPNITWCLEAILSLLKQEIYAPADLNYRMFQGTKYRRSLIHALLFKQDLHQHLLNAFAPGLEIQGEHLALLRSELRDFKTFDALRTGCQDMLAPSATLPAKFLALPDHAQRLAAYIMNVIFRDHDDKKIFQQPAGKKRNIKEWVDSSPDLQMIAAEARNAGLAGSVPASGSSCPALEMGLPSICSIAFPQLDDEGYNEETTVVYDIVKRSVDEVKNVVTRLIRVLDSKVDDGTSGCPDSQMFSVPDRVMFSVPDRVRALKGLRLSS